MSTRLEVRSVHESTTTPTNTPLWLLPRLPHEKHTIALTLILVYFRSIQFKLSNNQAQLSKQSLTADAAIRIVLLTLQGSTATHTKLSVTALASTPFKRVSARIISTNFTSQPTQVQWRRLSRLDSTS